MRSTRTEKYAAFFEFMGVNSKSLTDEQLEKIEEDGSTNDWLCSKLGVVRGDRVFEDKTQRWWEGERFILYPELYKKELSSFLNNGLPQLLATYVRGQFTGSSERITMPKIEATVKAMLKENPTWWYEPRLKKTFLERFSTDYPGCCDGKRPESQAKPPAIKPTAPAISVNRVASVSPTRKPAAKRKSKTSAKDTFNTIIGLIVILVILYFIFR